MAKIKMVMTDMDGSAVRYKTPPFYSGWDAIGDALPPHLRKKWYETRDYYYPKPKLYSEWFIKQVELLKGLNTKGVARKIFPIPYAPGFLNFFKHINPEILTGLISSGVDFIANRIRQEAGLDIVICNKIYVYDGRFAGTGAEIVGLWSKLEILKKQADICEIPLEQICYVGDSENDLEVLKAVGRPYIINPHPNVKGLAPEIKNYLEIKLD
jgi:HAD superfamily phosphoserine phosphatase-like hydrolase